ncbi:uncharacterized protein LOC103849556 [Brassica rapa]|uniref:Replication protein A OB domain-containing protein n=1 Tax=Brassica campestris TaxID=3711 RepID=M4FEW3_BRACM|nr:uncharacterized protein LOC103849556 [Brassica rapa]XP_048634944.1 uncharacterized protein LOC125608571 [Brassica napus]
MVGSATSFVFDDLRKGFNKNEVLARVVHFWEARNVNKGGLLLGFELFLIDQKHTVLAPTDYAGHDIERQNFRIRSYAEFNEAVNKNKNEDLYDALGKLVLINNENFNNGVTNKRIDIHLQLKDGPIVRVTLWGNGAANFQKKLMESVDKPMVLLATTMNPRTFRGL